MSAAHHEARVLDVEQVAQGFHLLRLAAPALAREARAGQFVMVRCSPPHDPAGPGSAPYLRRPLALHGIHPDVGVISLLFEVVGRGTAALAAARPGARLDLLGPLGRRVELDPGVQSVLVVAGGTGIASLTALLDDGAARGWRMTLLAGARTARRLYPSRLLPPGVVEMTATDDGSAGVRAPVTHLVPQVQKGADVLVACGPTPMLHALARLRGEGLLRLPAIVLLESRMGCGFGACMACTVATRTGVRLVCAEGPAFDLDEVLWDHPLGPHL